MNELPRVYNPARLQAKQVTVDGYKKYKLYWRGTLNEVFPGELFYTADQAKRYCHAMIIKNNKLGE
jgi:hypothetical protein